LNKLNNGTLKNTGKIFVARKTSEGSDQSFHSCMNPEITDRPLTMSNSKEKPKTSRVEKETYESNDIMNPEIELHSPHGNQENF
jgi:hypothetical protein